MKKSHQNNVHYRHLGREMALQFCFQSEVSGCSCNDSAVCNVFWEQMAGEYDGDERTFRRARRYAETLIVGVANTRSELDELIQRFAVDWDLERIAIVDRNIIRIAIFEMLYISEVPPIVSIDEAMLMTREFSDGSMLNFINGLLNAVKNNLNSLRKPSEACRS